MEDCVAELADTCNGIHSLPDKVARVEVCTDLRTDCFAKTKKAVAVINAEAGMKLKCNLVNTVSLCKLNKVFPVGDKNFVPLPLKDFAEIVGPRASYPVGILCTFVVTGAT